MSHMASSLISGFIRNNACETFLSIWNQTVDLLYEHKLMEFLRKVGVNVNKRYDVLSVQADKHDQILYKYVNDEKG